MAVYQFKDDGIKGSMDALAGIMQTMGQHERQRQDFQLSQNLMKIASEPAASPEDRLQKVYSEVANFKPQNSGGLGGIMQKAGGFFAPQSQIPAQMGSVAIADMLAGVQENRSGEQKVKVEGAMTPVVVDRAEQLAGVDNQATLDLQDKSRTQNFNAMQTERPIARQYNQEDMTDRNQATLTLNKGMDTQSFQSKKEQRPELRNWAREDLEDRVEVLKKELATRDKAEQTSRSDWRDEADLKTTKDKLTAQTNANIRQTKGVADINKPVTEANIKQKEVNSLLSFFDWHSPEDYPSIFSKLIKSLGGTEEEARIVLEQRKQGIPDSSSPVKVPTSVVRGFGPSIQPKTLPSKHGSAKKGATIISPDGTQTYDNVSEEDVKQAVKNGWRVQQ